MEERLVDRQAPEGMKWKIKVYPVVNGVEVIVQLRQKRFLFSHLYMQMSSLIAKEHLEPGITSQGTLIAEIRMMQDLMNEEESQEVKS